jgi:SAM-dependent methyltransferase
MGTKWVFDSDDAQDINRCRQQFLDYLWQEWPSHLGLRTAVDAGCGIGLFSDKLVSLGLNVVAFDARVENICEAKRRYSNIDFHVLNVEDPRLGELGQFDVALCFGLLYHLENPMLAIRNLYAITKKILIIESIIAPSRLPTASLVDESPGEDQGLNYFALIPSESAFIKMLYHAGFLEVYEMTRLPNHNEFRATALHQRRRTILLASRLELDLQFALFRPASEPHQDHLQIWYRSWIAQQIAWRGSKLRAKFRRQ